MATAETARRGDDGSSVVGDAKGGAVKAQARPLGFIAAGPPLAGSNRTLGFVCNARRTGSCFDTCCR